MLSAGAILVQLFIRKGEVVPIGDVVLIEEVDSVEEILKNIKGFAFIENKLNKKNSFNKANILNPIKNLDFNEREMILSKFTDDLDV